MRCEKCDGTGKVEGGRVICLIELPCRECGGTGVVQCCEGAPTEAQTEADGFVTFDSGDCA